MQLNALLSRFNMEPAFVAPEATARFEACIRAVEMHEHSAEMLSPSMDADSDFWNPDRWTAAYRPYVVRDAVLLIPVKGVLLHDFPYALGNWATGYEYIWQAFKRGMSDLGVKGIALVCDTPGGMVAGNFELVDRMFALRGTKPVRGYAAESAYSAGYSIISVSDPGQITVSRTGGVGSIGVVTSHVDYSAAFEKMGVKVTFIFAGKHKVDGNAYEALPDDVKARIQTRIDALYDIFVATVARNRGMDEKAVRATEALTFGAAEATSNGLADNIGPLDDALVAFATDLNSDTAEEDEDMSTEPKGGVDQAAHDAAVAAARTEGTVAGHKEGVTAERGRITAILASDAGKLRPKAALSAALRTDMTVEQATAFLAELPEEKAEVTKPETTAGGGTDSFTEAMNREGGTGVGAGQSDQQLSFAEQILADQNAFTGRGKKAA